MREILPGLKALADENRLKIVTLLLRYDFCVGALAWILGISKAAVSQQLQILRKAGLVRSEKRGYWTHYSVNREALVKLSEGLNNLGEGSALLRYGCRKQALADTQLQDQLLERREEFMCRCCCQKPEKLESEPGKCSPEKIKECHGDTEKHPCLDKDE
ncbi:MAG: metalloregulator ArsR/SmtB family transcription factor [Bacillota bacterium]